AALPVPPPRVRGRGDIPSRPLVGRGSAHRVSGPPLPPPPVGRRGGTPDTLSERPARTGPGPGPSQPPAPAGLGASTARPTPAACRPPGERPPSRLALLDVGPGLSAWRSEDWR